MVEDSSSADRSSVGPAGSSVTSPADGQVSPAAPGALATSGPRLLVFGDSVAAGAGSPTPPSSSFAYDLGEQLGWGTAVNAVSGTGYVNKGSAPGLDLSYGARLEALPDSGLAADVVVVEGGLNDRGVPADQLAAAATRFLQSLRARAPMAQLVVVGAIAPDPGDPTSTAEFTEVNAALSTVAAQQNVTFIDPVAEQWFTPQNSAAYIAPDRLHPTQAGHAYIATLLSDHLRGLTRG
ncbi:SGNH/GDSL hydrolase family protein [Modestobacter italicus]|uniref:SGNH/GDSL hydrolase family protein n=1 Tax=Modestobacter italicus (strain DSM 44449 / CECT 9708 / BC 501) TaxID=2732864 RepID=UPI001C97452E|nr:SGNH/GDSL hydrolase family protein [Modestobacter italicus]